MKRRDFLIGAAAISGLTSASRSWAQGANPGKLDRVAIMSLNFDAILKAGVGAPPDAARTLDVMDFPQMVADRYGVHRVELQHAHLLSTEDPYLKDLRDRIAKAKSQLIQINLEFGGSNVSGNFSSRAQGIDLAKQWIDHAEALGCPRVQVQQGTLAPEVRQNASDALKILHEYGKAHKVTVTVENRDNGIVPPPPPPPPPPAAAGDTAAPARGRIGGGGGRGNAGPPPPPATWQVVVEVVNAAGIAATPNFANFPNETERAAGLRAMYPLSAGTCHCTSEPQKYSLANALKIAKEVGYKGLYSIQASGPDPHAATKAILDELLKNI